MTAVALATCSAFPAGDEDSSILVAAFERAGVTTSWQVWDDPTVEWSTFDATLLRSTWDYTPRRAEFLEWAGRVPLLVNPYPVLAWSSDKVYLRDLAAAGIPVVPTTFVEPGQPLPELPAGEYVVKPSVGAGSVGAGRFRLPDDRDAARAHLALLHARQRTALVQPYVTGVDTAGETAVVCAGGAVSHAARKSALLAPGTVRPLDGKADANDHGLFVQETMVAIAADAAQAAVAEQVLAYVGERFGAVPVYARVDLLPGADGPVVIEAELVEPSLFLAYAPDPAAAADRLVGALTAVLGP